MSRVSLWIGLASALALVGCDRKAAPRADAVHLPETDDEFFSVPAGATAEEILPAVDAGLVDKSKVDGTRFLVIRSADRHPPEVKDSEFHVVVGAGVRLPKGSMRIRRAWSASGRIDGNNEQLQTLGLSLAVERGAALPFPPEVAQSVTAFCEALCIRLPLHPDCVVAMGEVPYTNPHPADGAERAVAKTARARVPVPPADTSISIRTQDKTLEVACEKRDTPHGIVVGMMMRKRFDGENRGMLFVYPWKEYRWFWMRNCFLDIDVAYIREGKIEQIYTMRAEAGTKPSEIPHYESNAAVRYALEMPGGWFEANGVRKGDAVEIR